MTQKTASNMFLILVFIYLVLSHFGGVRVDYDMMSQWRTIGGTDILKEAIVFNIILWQLGTVIIIILAVLLFIILRGNKNGSA